MSDAQIESALESARRDLTALVSRLAATGNARGLALLAALLEEVARSARDRIAVYPRRSGERIPLEVGPRIPPEV